MQAATQFSEVSAIRQCVITDFETVHQFKKERQVAFAINKDYCTCKWEKTNENSQ